MGYIDKDGVSAKDRYKAYHRALYLKQRDQRLRYRKEYWEANKEEISLKNRSVEERSRRKKYDKLKYENKLRENPKRFWLYKANGAAKHRAKKRGIPYDAECITLDDVPDRCPVFDVELDFSLNKKSAVRNSPSLDRVIPELGYVKGNVVCISHRANTMKQDASLQEIAMLLNYVKSRG